MIRGAAIATRFCRRHFLLLDTSRPCEFFPRTAAHALNGRAGSRQKASAPLRHLGCSRDSLRADSKLSPTDSARKQFVRGMRCFKLYMSPMTNDMTVVSSGVAG